MKKINRKLQYIVFGLLVIMLTAGYSDGGGYLMMAALWAMPLGFMQFIGSLLDVLIKRSTSKHKWHLGLSILVLLNLSDILPFKEFNILAWYSCGALAIYYWILVFAPTKKIIEQEHSVYDL